MHIDEFDFTLPNEQIAQEPIADRTASRLMVVDRQSGERMHTIFSQLPQYLSAGDLLVLNDSRVRPARLIGIKEETGAKIELLLLKPLGEDRWEALVKPAKRVKKGTVIRFGEQGELTAIAEEERPFAGGRSFLLQYPEGADLEELFNRLGQMPLPPYIRQELADPERYQTVYSREVGSAAAPTAGLHFTESLLEEVKAKGVQIAFLTLHVGLGTFRPVTAERIEEHQMHAEFYHLPQKTAQQIAQTRKNGGRVIAVGTTSVRTLETIAQQGETLQETSGWTDIFIYPGYRFRLVDGIVTNFHLPKSTLLMLVSAFSSREKILAAYREAVEKGYRFFSFGDSMFLC